MKLHQLVAIAMTCVVAPNLFGAIPDPPFSPPPGAPLPPFVPPVDEFEMPEGWNPVDPSDWAFPEFPALPPLDAHIHRVPSEYDTIQDAIDAASDGHTVLLENEVYIENVEIMGKYISIESEVGGTTLWPLDDAPVMVIVSGTLEDPVQLSDLTVRSTMWLPGAYDPQTGEWPIVEVVKPAGAGVLAFGSAVLLERCGFDGLNNSEEGGTGFPGAGLTAMGSVIAMESCSFEDCRAHEGGAVAVYQSIIAMTYCSVDECTSDGSGAGVGLWGGSFGWLHGCTFQDNAAWSQGGGVYLNGGDTNCTVNRCVFSGNTAAWGGAGYSEGDEDNDLDPVIANCRFSNNAAGEYGDHWYAADSSSPTIGSSSLCGHDEATYGMALSPFNNHVFDDCKFCPCDADGSQYIDVDDLFEVLNTYGTPDPIADVDEGGTVDVMDLVFVLQYWGDCWTINWDDFEFPGWDDGGFPPI